MKQTTIHYIAAKECPYTLNGRKLTELRRARLRAVAEGLKVSTDGSKNELLKRIIAKLNVIGADSEIGNG